LRRGTAARSEAASGVTRNAFITFVLCPALGMSAKTLLLRAFGGLHPNIGARHYAARRTPRQPQPRRALTPRARRGVAAWCIVRVPDLAFVPVATALVTTLTPILLERHDAAAVARRKAAPQGDAAGGAPGGAPGGPPAKSRRAAALLLNLLALLLAVLVPVLLATAWPLVEPRVLPLLERASRAVRPA
jgi:hypothetical protein